MQIRCFEDFRALRAACPPLADAAHAGELFETLDWFELLSREALPAGTPLQLLAATADTGATLCLPLMRQGRNIASLSNYYTGIYGPISGGDSNEGWRGEALTALCRHLRTACPRPAAIRLYPLDPSGELFRDMRDALTSAGYRVGSHFGFGNWHLPCAGLCFADYFAGRPSALRNTVRRARSRLDKAGQWNITIHTAPGAGLDQAIADFETIYRRSWKSAESYPGFVRELCRLAARRGWLRLGVLSLDGAAIASQIWLFDNGKASIFKLAYDPDAAHLSPGSVLTAAMMENALDRDAAREIDYLSGDDAYKQDWMSHRRERHGLVAFDLAMLRGLLAALRHFGGQTLRRLRP
ncbi:MAG: GNAT family N-acetyltransferase [Rhodocyclaceae bacterium]|nr:GNAT family N-acetyltransferase [Rhodocyclaceae bacterium]